MAVTIEFSDFSSFGCTISSYMLTVIWEGLLSRPLKCRLAPGLGGTSIFYTLSMKVPKMRVVNMTSMRVVDTTSS